MSHPNNLSEEYPVQGDTWEDDKGNVVITVTCVSPTGVITYMRDIHCGDVRKTKAELYAFKAELERRCLTIPDYCTDKYYRTYGAL